MLKNFIIKNYQDLHNIIISFPDMRKDISSTCNFFLIDDTELGGKVYRVVQVILQYLYMSKTYHPKESLGLKEVLGSNDICDVRLEFYNDYWYELSVSLDTMQVMSESIGSEDVEVYVNDDGEVIEYLKKTDDLGNYKWPRFIQKYPTVLNNFRVKASWNYGKTRLPEKITRTEHEKRTLIDIRNFMKTYYPEITKFVDLPDCPYYSYRGASESVKTLLAELPEVLEESPYVDTILCPDLYKLMPRGDKINKFIYRETLRGCITPIIISREILNSMEREGTKNTVVKVHIVKINKNQETSEYYQDIII